MKLKSIGNIFRFLNKNKAFTLIEMMITVVIFSIIIGTATGAFVSAIKLQKYNLAYQRLLDQTSYAMEYMSRAIRMAKRNDAGTCSAMAPAMGDENYYPDTGNEIHFATYHDPSECWKFFLQDGQLKINKNGTEYDLTSDDFDIKSFNVVVSGDGTADGLQPRVTIFMEIHGKGSGSQPKIRIQTTISQRDLDI